MCRWFAYISADEACLLEDVLITPQHGLSKMVNEHYLPGLLHSDPDKRESDVDKECQLRNMALNVDGLGLAWYNSARQNFVKHLKGTRPMVYKSVSPPLNDYNYRNLCENTETKTLFAHVRATSGSPVMQANCHPFIFGRHCFMHNGTIMNFNDIRRPLSNTLDRDTYLNVQGSTDTEHLAALYVSILTKGRGKEAWEEEYSVMEMAAALMEAIGRVIKLQKEVLGSDARPNSINLAVTDGSQLVTFRFRNHKTQQPPSLYWSTTAGTTLNRKYPGHPNSLVNVDTAKDPAEHGKHLIVASEPTTMQAEEWNLIDRNHCVTFDKDGNVEIKEISYDESWNADDEEFVMVEKPMSCFQS